MGKRFAPSIITNALLSATLDVAQVDRASAMIEKLCTPSDDDHNEHKKLQLRELAALNGTLKEVTECYLCGMEGHTPEMCPNKVRPRPMYGSTGWVLPCTHAPMHIIL